MAWAAVLGLAVACGRPSAPSTPTPPSTTADYRLAPDEFSVMTYNLQHYSLEDRDGDGQMNDPKPMEERQAIMAIIQSVQPDVLCVQEIGNRTIFDEFVQELEQAGLRYEFQEFLQRNHSENNLAVLSRRAIVSFQSHLDDKYSIGSAQVPVLRGFIDVDIGVNPGYQFRLLVAHLKSKAFHELGQTEMRRNEARLLNNHVRAALKKKPDLNLLVVGDLNDSPESAALNEVRGTAPVFLHDLRPPDEHGDVWTHFQKFNDTYARIDYALVSAGMLPEVVAAKSRVVRHPLIHRASDHRPVVVVFKARDLPMDPTPR
jgi:endonuclease/exonuclease/phosphatase family metal-dependent hydrolase